MNGRSWLKASLSRIFDCSGSMAIGLVSDIERGDGDFSRGFIRAFSKMGEKTGFQRSSYILMLRGVR